MLFSILSYVAAFAVGAVVGIFFYRNNEEKLDPIADKVDEKVDEAKEKAAKKKAKK